MNDKLFWVILLFNISVVYIGEFQFLFRLFTLINGGLKINDQKCFFKTFSILVKGNSTLATPTDEDEDDWDEDESSEVEDEGNKVYKNPRNSPSTLCPRDEEQATLLVVTWFSVEFIINDQTVCV